MVYYLLVREDYLSAGAFLTPYNIMQFKSIRNPLVWFSRHLKYSCLHELKYLYCYNEYDMFVITVQVFVMHIQKFQYIERTSMH